MWPQSDEAAAEHSLCPADLTSWDGPAAMPPGSWSPARHEELTQRNEEAAESELTAFVQLSPHNWLLSTAKQPS